MFEFKRKINVWSHANTDVNYLEAKDKALENLKGIKDRIFEVVFAVDEDAKYNWTFLNNTLNTAFVPKNVANYNQELKQHILLMQSLVDNFKKFMIAKINEILNENTYRTSMLKNKINTENLFISDCRNKYPETCILPLITNGNDVLNIEDYVNQVIAKFHASVEYIEVLYRSRMEQNLKR